MPPSLAVTMSQLMRRQAESVFQKRIFTGKPFLKRRTISFQTVPHTRSISQQSPRGHLATKRINNPFFRRHFFQQRFSSAQAQTPPQSLSQRLKNLSREYGWSAVGVYLALSVLDFPFCFATVRLLGVERIGHFEHVVMERVKGAFGNLWPLKKDSDDTAVGTRDDLNEEIDDHGVIEARRRNAEEGASIWTQLALAYAIHKSFIFLRVPLTAAVTPKVVKTLRRWGWNIGKKTPKAK
ncbi:putative peptide alpha-N-acetyltransferase Nat2 [Talaromyces proteolyticus]|uniref:Peptide alpha-N-acetyltransferase Nat2 n=1 Tax=Talaromyces proteolyticus TaxID=1131652 RepID=A0AAD4PXU1_9EURO|nr:putative peptide alpha-N-acetyltransferase Nat2 [Talaromyces proteolyticus]KAH8693123.1 putative peptide alpha-N-acetyltransferase Nat2 [Talaromyces proteolyticus]